MKNIFFLILFLPQFISWGQVKVLFDATKAQMAGNADWVIDADEHDIGFSNGVLNYNGNESDPQRFPTPDQSTVTDTTREDYWAGGISAWGIDAVQAKFKADIEVEFQVETLPVTGKITYGDASNEQDLSHYNIFVVVEPNWLFTAEEKTAIYDFVYNGGNLFLISDHTNSDRDGDGYDSVDVWDDFLTDNHLGYNPFGIEVNYENFTEGSYAIADLPDNPVLYGPYGDVTEVEFYAGTSFTVDYTQNPEAQALVFRNENMNNYEQVMIASTVYGKGKVLAVGDSSIVDDGTGDPNDKLYDGWIKDANGNHRRLIMNAMIWMAQGISGVENYSTNFFKVYTRGKNLIITSGEEEYKDGDFNINIYDMEGKVLKKEIKFDESSIIPLNFPSGIYIYTLKSGEIIIQAGKIFLN